MKKLKAMNQGISETKRNAAINMLKRGKLTIQEIAEDLGLKYCGSRAACRISKSAKQ